MMSTKTRNWNWCSSPDSGSGLQRAVFLVHGELTATGARARGWCCWVHARSPRLFFIFLWQLPSEPSYTRLIAANDRQCHGGTQLQHNEIERRRRSHPPAHRRPVPSSEERPTPSTCRPCSSCRDPVIPPFARACSGRPTTVSRLRRRLISGISSRCHAHPSRHPPIRTPAPRHSTPVPAPPSSAP